MKKIDSRFEAMLEDVLHGLQDIAIIQDENCYIVFNRYVITPRDGEIHVNNRWNWDAYTFCNMRHAITWCVYDHRNRIIDANNIRSLDRQYSSAMFEIALHRQLSQRSNKIDDYCLQQSKLLEAQLQLNHIRDQIDDYIHDSKSFQTQKFQSKAKYSV